MAKFSEGDKAPNFKLTDVFGKKVALDGYKNKTILVSFFRYAGCPWCNLAIARLTKEYPKLKEHNIEVICFVQSKKENIQTNIFDRHTPKPPFPIIADPNKEIYNKYGVKDSVVAGVKSITQIPAWVRATTKYKQKKIDGSLLMVPAQFLVDSRDLTIIKAHYGANYNDQMPFIEIIDASIFGTGKDLKSQKAETQNKLQ